VRVLFATDHIHVPQGGGGGERNTHELCLALRNRAVTPAVMCSLSPKRSWLSWSNRLRRVVPPRHRFPRDNGCGYPVYRGWSKDGAHEVVARFRPDVVVVQSTHPAALLMAFASCRVSTAAYFHEVAEIDHLTPLAHLPITILANSPFTAQRLQNRCGLSAAVILPLIDPAQYVTTMRPERVLFVNTVPRKGVEIAFALAKARPDIRFDFVQSWILNADQVRQLRRRAGELGNIDLHPPVQDMRPLYARARLVLAPSQWEEAWGRIATEAHVNAIPVLGSDRGGLPQAIGPGGIIVPADAPFGDWADALSRLWDDAGAYAAASNAARAYSKRPDIQPDTITAKLCAALTKLASRSPVVADYQTGRSSGL
jgi:glycosyltransferase involved in cell wall biosynthesis